MCKNCSDSIIIINSTVGNCFDQADPGECEESIPRFFFNERTGQCDMFLFSGCGGNGNNFKTFEECTAACNPDGK